MKEIPIDRRSRATRKWKILKLWNETRYSSLIPFELWIIIAWTNATILQKYWILYFEKVWNARRTTRSSSTKYKNLYIAFQRPAQTDSNQIWRADFAPPCSQNVNGSGGENRAVRLASDSSMKRSVKFRQRLASPQRSICGRLIYLFTRGFNGVNSIWLAETSK